jgi:hypothetical protein
MAHSRVGARVEDQIDLTLERGHNSNETQKSDPLEDTTSHNLGEQARHKEFVGSQSTLGTSSTLEVLESRDHNWLSRFIEQVHPPQPIVPLGIPIQFVDLAFIE